jgi:DNA-binding response OmpR family regulator
MEDRNMPENTQPTILLIGNDSTLSYLLGRFAEQSGYLLAVISESLSALEIESIDPAVIIFMSTELLAAQQALLVELASHEAPILVCSSVIEEARARELGADYCLLHPLTYADFHTTLSNASASKHD